MPPGHIYYVPFTPPQRTVPPFLRFTPSSVVDESPLYLQPRRRLLNRITETWYAAPPLVQQRRLPYHAGMYPDNPIPSNFAANLNKILSQFTSEYASKYSLYIRAPKLNFGLFVDTPPQFKLAQTLEQILAQHFPLPFLYTDPYTRQRKLPPSQLDVPSNPPLISLARTLAQLLGPHYDVKFDLTDRRLFRKILVNPTILFGHEPPPPYLLPQTLDTLLSTFQPIIMPIQRKRVFLYDVPLPPAPPATVGFIAFQPNAFQVGYPSPLVAFQGFNRYIALGELSVAPFLILLILVDGELPVQTKRAGDSIVLGARTYDPTGIPPKLYDPESVRLTLYNPDGTVRLSNVVMTRVTTGQYAYIHQTSTSHPRGVYLGDILAQNFGQEALVQKQALFRLVD